MAVNRQSAKIGDQLCCKAPSKATFNLYYMCIVHISFVIILNALSFRVSFHTNELERLAILRFKHDRYLGRNSTCTIMSCMSYPVYEIHSSRKFLCNVAVVHSAILVMDLWDF